MSSDGRGSIHSSHICKSVPYWSLRISLILKICLIDCHQQKFILSSREFSHIYLFISFMRDFFLSFRRMKIEEEKKNKLLYKQVHFFGGVSFRFSHLVHHYFVSFDFGRTHDTNESNTFVSVLKVKIMAKLLWPLHSDIMMISRLGASAVRARARTHTHT